MVTLVMVFHAADYESWRKASAGFFRNAGRGGVTRQQIFRAVDDPNEVMLLIDLASRADAERIMQRKDELRASLDAAQITVYPSAFVGERVEELEYPRT